MSTSIELPIETIGDLKSALKRPGRVYVGTAFTVEDVNYVQVIKADLIETIKEKDNSMEIVGSIDTNGDVWLS